MEYILNSYNRKVTDNYLRFNFKKPIRFIDQKYHLRQLNITTISRISNKFSMSVKYNKNNLIQQKLR